VVVVVVVVVVAVVVMLVCADCYRVPSLTFSLFYLLLLLLLPLLLLLLPPPLKVGHSIGGWITRAYLGEVIDPLERRNRIASLTTLGTPHTPPTEGLLARVRDKEGEKGGGKGGLW